MSEDFALFVRQLPVPALLKSGRDCRFRHRRLCQQHMNHYLTDIHYHKVAHLVSHDSRRRTRPGWHHRTSCRYWALRCPGPAGPKLSGLVAEPGLFPEPDTGLYKNRSTKYSCRNPVSLPVHCCSRQPFPRVLSFHLRCGIPCSREQGSRRPLPVSLSLPVRRHLLRWLAPELLLLYR